MHVLVLKFVAPNSNYRLSKLEFYKHLLISCTTGERVQYNDRT